jgi:hypothetical protein
VVEWTIKRVTFSWIIYGQILITEEKVTLFPWSRIAILLRTPQQRPSCKSSECDKINTAATNSKIATPLIEGTAELAAAVFVLLRHARKTVESFEKSSGNGLFWFNIKILV